MFFRESSKVDFDVNFSSNILANSNHLKIPLNLDLLVQSSKLNTYTIGLIIDHFFLQFLCFLNCICLTMIRDKLISTNYMQEPNAGLLIHLSA